MQSNLDFDLEDVSGADNGCGATFLGQFWYFGDDSKVSLIGIIMTNLVILHIEDGDSFTKLGTQW